MRGIGNPLMVALFGLGAVAVCGPAQGFTLGQEYFVYTGRDAAQLDYSKGRHSISIEHSSGWIKG
jgi:hypothetical protein